MTMKIEFKVGLFIIIIAILILASIVYIAFKKDLFSKVYTYTLSSKTGENITEGTPVVFWGFNIGKVSSMKLTENAVLVQIEIPERNNHVIRAGSSFVLEKPLFGSSRIIVYTDNLNSPPLSSDVYPRITVSDDINELIKRVQTIAEKMDKIAGNMTTITGDMADPQGDMNQILKNAEKVTSFLAEKESLTEMLVGDKESVKALQEIINNARDITVNLDGIISKIDSLVMKTDEDIHGSEGLFALIRNILNDLTAKLAQVEIALDNFNQVSGETVDATKDLNVLRSEVDEMVISIRNLIDDLDRIIPFKAESEISLP